MRSWKSITMSIFILLFVHFTSTWSKQQFFSNVDSKLSEREPKWKYVYIEKETVVFMLLVPTSILAIYACIASVWCY